MYQTTTAKQLTPGTGFYLVDQLAVVKSTARTGADIDIVIEGEDDGYYRVNQDHNFVLVPTMSTSK